MVVFYLPVLGNQAKVQKELRPDLHEEEGRKLGLVVVIHDSNCQNLLTEFITFHYYQDLY